MISPTPPLPTPPCPGSSLWRNCRIGLLGGSFNPPHRAHVHISLEALHRLKLHQVWWLVSPQNPLKPSGGTPPLNARLQAARQLVQHPRIQITGLEADLGTQYSADSVYMLRSLFPETRFVWLMGADNLSQMRHWQAWQALWHMLPVAVFDRPGYSSAAMASLAAHRFRQTRVPERAAAQLALLPPPCWSYLHTRLDTISSTALRAESSGIATRRQSS